MLFSILSRGSNEQHTFNMSRRKMSWKVFILMRVCKYVQQYVPFGLVCRVQEHLVFHGNRVNRKLNIFFEASCISIVV